MLNSLNELNSSEISKIQTPKSARMIQLEKEGITIKLNKNKNIPMDLLVKRNELFELVKSTKNKFQIPKPPSSIKNMKKNDFCENEINYNHMTNNSNLSFSSLNNQNNLNNSFRKSIPLYKKKRLSCYLLRNPSKERSKSLNKKQNKSFSLKKCQSEKNLNQKCLSEKNDKKGILSKINNFSFSNERSKSKDKNDLKKDLMCIGNVDNNIFLSEKEEMRGGRIDLISSIYRSNKVKEEKNYYDKYEHLIIRIQSWWRRYLFRKYIKKIIIIQSFYRMFNQVKKFKLKRKNTIKIQSVFRQYIQKKKLKKLINVIKIQKYFKKYLKFKTINSENNVKKGVENMNHFMKKKYFEQLIRKANDFINNHIKIIKSKNSSFISKKRIIKKSQINPSVKLPNSYFTKNNIPINQILLIQKTYKQHYKRNLYNNQTNKLKSKIQNKLKNMFGKNINKKLSISFHKIYTQIKFFEFIQILSQKIQKRVQQDTYDHVKLYLKRNTNCNINEDDSIEDNNTLNRKNKETFYFNTIRKNLKMLNNNLIDFSDDRIYNLLNETLPKYFNNNHNRNIIPFINKNQSHILRTTQIYNNKENNLLSKYINFYFKTEKDFDLISDSFIERRLYMKQLYNRNIFGIMKYSNELFKDIIKGKICQNCFCKNGELCEKKCLCHEEPEINVIKKIYKYDEYITDNINESCDCVNYNIEIPDEKNYNIRKKIIVTNNPEDYIIENKINVIRIKGTKFNRPVTESDEFFLRNKDCSTNINSNIETIELIENNPINQEVQSNYCNHHNYNITSKKVNEEKNFKNNNNLLNYIRKNDENKNYNNNKVLKNGKGNGLLAKKINEYIEKSKNSNSSYNLTMNNINNNNVVFESNGLNFQVKTNKTKGNDNNCYSFSDNTFKKENINNLNNLSQIPDFDTVKNNSNLNYIINERKEVFKGRKNNIKDKLLNRNFSSNNKKFILQDISTVHGVNN